MTDLQMTKLCAEAMGYPKLDDDCEYYDSEGSLRSYHPLADDAQAMALVKQLRLSIDGAEKSGEWSAREWKSGTFALDIDLNRAVVECVARMQESR